MILFTKIGNKDEIIQSPIHPYTIELLLAYLRFHQNIIPYTCPSLEETYFETIQISPTHLVKNNYNINNINLPASLNELKERIYELIRN